MLAHERSAAGVSQPSGYGGRGIDVGDQQCLLERRGARDDLAVLVDHERVTVEDELVLTPDGVDERDPAHVVASARRQHLLALAPLPEVERRRGHVRDYMGAGER